MENKKKPDGRIQILLAFAAIYIIWGTTYLAIKIGIRDFPSFVMATIRYFIAGSIMLCYCLLKREKMFLHNVLHNIVLGSFVMTFGQAIAFWSEKYISSGLTAVFNAILPICYVLTDKRNWLFYKQSKLTVLSIGLGIAGIVILFIHPSEAELHSTGPWSLIASIVAVVSCFCWAIGSLYYKYNIRTGSLFGNLGWQLMGGMVSCAIIGLLFGEWKIFHIQSIQLSAWLSVFYLAIAGSIVALFALYWLLARRPAALVGTYAYVNPVIAVLLGFFIAGEKITVLQILGMALIVVAAYIANKVKFQAEKV